MMSLNRFFFRAWLIIGLVACFAPTSTAAVIFEADFNGATANSVGNESNANIANLNSGVSIGGFVYSGNTTATPDSRGSIISNGAGNNALVFDDGISTNTNRRLQGNFAQQVDLLAGEGLTFSVDFFAARQGGGRQVRLSFDSDAATDNKSYLVIFGLDNDKNISWLNTSNGASEIATSSGPNNGFQNGDVDNYLSWETGTMSRLTVEILPGETVEGATSGALATVDWDGDGVIEAGDGDVQNFAFGPRLAGNQNITSFELFYSGGGPRGLWLDNISASVTAIPEPSSVLALVGLALIGCQIRRRQRTV